MLAALIVAVGGVVTAVRWKLPAEHRITREAELPHDPDAVWTAISDLSALPAWMPGIRRVHSLDATDGRERWLYETAEGDMTIEVAAFYGIEIGPGSGSLAGKLCSPMRSSRRSSIAVTSRLTSF